jgi:hypothetical protein
VAREADPTNQRSLWLLGRTRMKAGQKGSWPQHPQRSPA